MSMKMKRNRTSKACTQCNKAKAKCEVSEDGISRCHRCERLGLECFFKGSSQPRPPKVSMIQMPGSSSSIPQAPSCIPCSVGDGNEGSFAARKLASALSNTPGSDSNLDCEKGIMRALTEFNYMATDIPIELLREWTLVSIQRRDCALLGRAMTLAAAGGHTMEALLENVGTLSSLLMELSGLVQKAAIANNPNQQLGDTSLIINPALCNVGSTEQADLNLPECTNWIKDSSGRGKQLVLVKQVINGKVSFFTNRSFETYVVSISALQASWAASGTPSIELFLHPEDAPILCGFVGALWRQLEPATKSSSSSSKMNAAGKGSSGDSATADNSSSTSSERTCMREMAKAVRLWVKGQVEGYVYCSGRVQLVVTNNSQGQISNLIFSFQPAQSHLLPQDRMNRQQVVGSGGSSSDYSSGGGGGGYGSGMNNNHANYSFQTDHVQVPSFVPSSHSMAAPSSQSIPPQPPLPFRQQRSSSMDVTDYPASPSSGLWLPEEGRTQGGGGGNVQRTHSFAGANTFKHPPELGDEILESSDFWDSVAAMASEYTEDSRLFLEV